jgi:hypothetical protein
MAVAAELFLSRNTEAYALQDTYLLVDAIPDVAAARQQERDSAEAIIERRRTALRVGAAATAEMPLPVDALSTAHKVLEAADTFGFGSAEHTERYQGLVLDCQRLVGEWYRKKKPEYFEPVRHKFDVESEEFFSHGLSVRQMTENALTPMSGNAEEEARRVNERVEDATPQILRRLGRIAVGEEAIRTISECTDMAIQEYAFDMQHGRKHRGYAGYVPEIEKVMIRDISLDAASNDRFEEQIGLPGVYITHYVIQKALQRRGAQVGDMDKTRLHGSQFIARDDLMDFVELLDTTASEEWCTDIFMGEQVPAGTVKNYAAFRREALQRQESLKDMAETVATFVLDLADRRMDRREAPSMVEEFVKKLLLDLGKKDFAAAEQMFDAKTAQGLRQVAYFEATGREQEAFDLMRKVEEAAPGGGFCGAGSCGLESVNLASEAGKELAKKVKAEAGDTVVKDKERACKCGSKSIVYAYNKKKVNKYCESCGAFESKASKAS